MNTVEIVGAAREMMIADLDCWRRPFLAGAVVASLLIGLFQASTRMNDLTLSFVPRFFAVLLVLYVAATWAAGAHDDLYRARGNDRAGVAPMSAC